MARNLVFAPLAVKARQAFVNSKHEAALEALCELDKFVQTHFESGTETFSKGYFTLKTMISVHQNAFLCTVVYSFTDRTIRWDSFAWKVAKAAQPPKPRQPPP